jgi:hypothetical protein
MPVRPLISVLGAASTPIHNAITRLCHPGNIRRALWMSDQRDGDQQIGARIADGEIEMNERGPDDGDAVAVPEVSEPGPAGDTP